jgi:glycosyltransferase involved in cell wall biosynthesis
MRAIFFVMKERKAQLDVLYDSIASNFEACDIVRITDNEQENLDRVFRTYDPYCYDRTIIFSRIKRLSHQARTLRWVPGLVFLEYDAWQNYMPESKNFGLFSKLYRSIPGCRVISSGRTVTRRLQEEGIDAHFVAKGYDDISITNRRGNRDIFAGFIGSIKHQSYAARRKTLETINDNFPITIQQTESGQAYVDALNRIRVFVSADSGMSEYMLKNFEAMAAGCVLLAEDQGSEENDALGLVDMHNVALYRSPQEAVEKLKLLRENPELCTRLSRNGMQLVHEHFRFSQLGRLIAEQVSEPMNTCPRPSLADRVIATVRHPWLKKRQQSRTTKTNT